MKKKTPKMREAAKNFTPYTPGKGIDEVREKYNIDNVVKLASNENLWGSCESARLAIEGEIKNIHLYPDPGAKKLVEALSKKHSVGVENIITGNGTDELIELIAKAFLGATDRLLTSAGSFVRYKMAAMLMGCGFDQAPRKNYRVSVDNLCEKVTRSTKVIFIDNPSNPAGTYISAREIKEIIEFIKKQDINPLFVVDEAYFEYARAYEGYESALQYMDSGVAVMVLRTFSKAYGLAGLRMGYGISSPGVIESLKRIKPPFNTNRLAQAAALSALDDERFIRRTVEETAREKEFLYEEFKKLGFETVPSATNFILTRVGREHTGEMCAHLEKRGVIVRPLAGYYYPHHLRITVGRRPHNKRIIKGIKDYFASRGKESL